MISGEQSPSIMHTFMNIEVIEVCTHDKETVVKTTTCTGTHFNTGIWDISESGC